MTCWLLPAEKNRFYNFGRKLSDTVVRTYPISEITAANISFLFGRRTYMKAVIQLVNHKDINTIVTRLEVTLLISQLERNGEKSIECNSSDS